MADLCYAIDQSAYICYAVDYFSREKFVVFEQICHNGFNLMFFKNMKKILN